MVVQHDKLKAQYQGLADDLYRLEGLENQLAPGGLKAVQWFADLVSDADETKENFNREIQSASEELQSAQRQLQAGNLEVASFSVGRADKMLERAGRLWGNYLKGTMEGAGDLESGLTPVAVGCGVTAGVFFGGWAAAPLLGLEVGAGTAAVATAGGLHAGGLTYLSNLEDVPAAEPLSSQNPSWTISWVGASEVNQDDLAPLAAESQGLLKAWAKDHSTPIPHGELYTRWEVITHPDPLMKLKKDSLLQKWKEDEIAYRAASGSQDSFDAQVSVLMDQLYAKEVGHYHPDHALLIDQAQGLGGNCEARTKRIIAALTASGIRFPKDRVLGLQPIKRPIPHLQPVIATLDENRKVKEVWDLVNDPHGKNKTARAEGPLYHAPILLHGHLLGQGLPSPLNDEDFLIEDADLLPSWASIADFLKPYWMGDAALGEMALKPTNSQLILPEGEGYMEPGNLVEHRSPNPALSKVGAPALASFSEIKFLEIIPKQSEPSEIKGDFAIVPEDHPLEAQKLRVKMKDAGTGFIILPHGSPGFSNKDPLVVFEKPAHRDYYNHSLKTEEEKFSFLLSLVQKKLREQIGSPTSLHFADIAADPKNLEKYDEKALAEVISWMQKTTELWEKILHTQFHPYFNKKFSNADGEKAEKILFTLLQEQDPKTAEALIAGYKFFARFRYNAGEFLPILNELSPLQKKQALDLLDATFPMYPRRVEAERFDRFSGVINLVADPSRVMIGDKIQPVQMLPTPEKVKQGSPEGIQADSGPKSVFVDIELLDDEEALDLIAKQKKEKGREEGADDKDQEGVKDAAEAGDRVSKNRKSPVEQASSALKKKESQDALSTQSAPLTIPPELFAAFLAHLSLRQISDNSEEEKYPDLYKRWTPAFSRAFMKLNREGRYDREFQLIYDKIGISRGIGAKEVPNPFDPLTAKDRASWIPRDVAMIANDIIRRRNPNYARDFIRRDQIRTMGQVFGEGKPLEELKDFRQTLLDYKYSNVLEEVLKVLVSLPSIKMSTRDPRSKAFARIEGRKLFLKLEVALDNDEDPGAGILLTDEFELNLDTHQLSGHQRNYRSAGGSDPALDEGLKKLKLIDPPSLHSPDLKRFAKALAKNLGFTPKQAPEFPSGK